MIVGQSRKLLSFSQFFFLLLQDDFMFHVLCEIPNLDFVFSSDDMDGPVEDIGSRSCVTRFVKTLLSIMEHGVKPHSKHLTEYFAFLYEFAKMGEEEVSIALQFWELGMYMHVCIFK